MRGLSPLFPVQKRALNGLRDGPRGIEGQFIEVLPEAEVMELLQRRPVTLTWLRRKAAPAAEQVPEEETKLKEAPLANRCLQTYRIRILYMNMLYFFII